MEAEEQAILKITKSYSKETKIIQAMEEASELITALSHYRRYRRGSRSELLEEMVDMDLMLRQLKIITEAEDDELDPLRQQKIQRQLNRIQNGDGEEAEK